MFGEDIIVDSREQKPYSFSYNSSTEALPVGDYSLKGYEKVFAVERKTLDDLANSLGNDRDRFEDEMERARELRMQELTVLIEAPRWHVYKYSGDKHSPHYYSNIYPNSIIGSIASWRDRYQFLDWEWAGDRAGGRARTLELLDEWYSDYSDE
jgi:ERCC4-type nuclease